MSNNLNISKGGFAIFSASGTKGYIDVPDEISRPLIIYMEKKLMYLYISSEHCF